METPVSQTSTLLGPQVLEPLQEPQTFQPTQEWDFPMSALVNFDQHLDGQADFSIDAVDLTSAETSQVTSAQSPVYNPAFQLLEQSIQDNPDPGAGGQESIIPTVNSRSSDSSPDTTTGSRTFREDPNHCTNPNTNLSRERSLANQLELLFGVGGQAQEQADPGVLRRQVSKSSQNQQVSAGNTELPDTGIRDLPTA